MCNDFMDLFLLFLLCMNLAGYISFYVSSHHLEILMYMLEARLAISHHIPSHLHTFPQSCMACGLFRNTGNARDVV